MKKIVKSFFAVLLMLIFLIQFCGCGIKLTKDSVKNDSEEVVRSNAITKMNIKLNLGNGNAIVIDLNEEIDESLLSGLNIDEITLLRYGYYAKYDYEFSNSTYVDYFNQYSWYEPINKNVDNSLTLIDKENIALIKKYEEKLTSSSLPTPSSTQTQAQADPPVQNNTSIAHEIWLNLSDGRTVVIDLDRKISADFLWQLTTDELAYIRNGYYAKHGYKFSMDKYLNYFSQYSWYAPVSSNVESKLTALDKENVARIQQYEKGNISSNSSNNNIGTYYVWLSLDNGNEVAVDLNQRLSENLLWQLNSDYLAVLRNAYYAKSGYIFSTKMYSDYFMQYTWYKPRSKNVESSLSKVDKENIALIQKYE